LNASQPAAIYYLLSINICIELCVASIKSIPHVRSNLGKDTVRLLTKVLICNKKPTMPNVMHILKFRNFLMHFYGAIALLSVVILLCDTLILTNVMMNTFTMLLSYQASCRWCKEWFLLRGTVWWWTGRRFLLENNTLDCSTLWENLLHSVLC